MRSMKLSIRPPSIPSPRCGQLLTLHYGIINLSLQHAGAPTGKHAGDQRTVSEVSVKTQGNTEMTSGPEF